MSSPFLQTLIQKGIFLEGTVDEEILSMWLPVMKDVVKQLRRANDETRAQLKAKKRLEN